MHHGFIVTYDESKSKNTNFTNTNVTLADVVTTMGYTLETPLWEYTSISTIARTPAHTCRRDCGKSTNKCSRLLNLDGLMNEKSSNGEQAAAAVHGKRMYVPNWAIGVR
jgi:hypothetical protein